MKAKPLLATLSGAAALAVAFTWPVPSSGQADAGDPAMAKILNEITGQQIVLAENQTKLDEKIAKIAEDVRLARIYAGRSGGKVP